MRNLMILAKWLAAQADVDVIAYNGSTACIGKNPDTGKLTIRIPASWCAVSDEETVELLEGMIDHEALGHGRYTQFEADDEAKDRGYDINPFTKSVCNILEDVMIETKAIATYPGVQSNLVRTVQIVKDKKGFFGSPEQFLTADPMQLVMAGLLTCLRSECVPGQDKVLGDYASILHTLLDAKMGPVWTEVHSIGLEVKNSNLSIQNWQLTQRIFDVLKDAAQGKAPPDQSGKCDDEGEDESDDQGQGQGQSKDDSEGDPSDGNGKAKAQSDGSDDDASGDEKTDADGKGDAKSDANSDGKGDDGDADADGKTDAKGDANADGKGDEPADADGEGQGQGSDSAQGDPGKAKPGNAKGSTGAGKGSPDAVKPLAPEVASAAADLMDNLDVEIVTDISTAASAEIAIEAAKCQASSIRTVEKLQEIELRPDQKRIASQVNAVSDDLKEALIAQSYSGKFNKLVGKRLNSRILSRVRTGNPRVFQSKTHCDGTAAAVSILVDTSGSMNAPMSDRKARFEASIGVTVGLADVLDEFDVPCEISFYDDKFSTYKAFDDDWNSVRKANAFPVPGGGTTTGAALQNALSELILRDEPRRLMIVITDGDTSDFDVLASCYGEAKHAGIEIASLMIGQRVHNIQRLADSVGYPVETHDSTEGIAAYVVKHVLATI